MKKPLKTRRGRNPYLACPAPAAGYDAPMSRRFQFSLKTLLAATAFVSACFGGWQIYRAHFAEFVKAETSLVGQPIRLSGRFSLKGAPDSTRFHIGVTRAGGKTLKGARKYEAERGRFGSYQFAEQATFLNQPRWTEPGEFDLYVLLPDGHYVAGRVSVKP